MALLYYGIQIHNTYVYVLLLDASQAFDKVNYVKLFKEMLILSSFAAYCICMLININI